MYINLYDPLETGLAEAAFPERIVPTFPEEIDRPRIADVVGTSALMTTLFSSSRKVFPVGLISGTVHSAERTYAFALMTASAVKQAEHAAPHAPVIVELGVGTAVNAVAALLASENARYIGYENDPDTARYARILLGVCNLEERATIIEQDFLKTDFAGIRADVVINENIHTYLASEPQLEAARAILPATHKQTLFIPRGFDINLRLGAGKEFHYFGQIDHRRADQFPLVLSHEFEAGEIPSYDFNACLATDLLNFNGERVMRASGTDLGNLSLSGLVGLNFGKLNPNKRQRIKITFECPPRPEFERFPERMFSLSEVD